MALVGGDRAASDAFVGRRLLLLEAICVCLYLGLAEHAALRVVERLDWGCLIFFLEDLERNCDINIVLNLNFYLMLGTDIW